MALFIICKTYCLSHFTPWKDIDHVSLIFLITTCLVMTKYEGKMSVKRKKLGKHFLWQDLWWAKTHMPDRQNNAGHFYVTTGSFDCKKKKKTLPGYSIIHPSPPAKVTPSCPHETNGTHRCLIINFAMNMHNWRSWFISLLYSCLDTRTTHECVSPVLYWYLMFTK